ncbi:MAG TPA: CocE/NonD family hydrolase [Thermoleophilaceae bacterium]|nr:CocE/NonD family hydrolase [Thermoleophilaceae bacterium]
MKPGLALLMLAAPIAVAFPAAASARDAKVTSFDGTSINVHFFPAAHLKKARRVPTVLVGPGWGQTGQTDDNSKTAPGAGVVGLGALRRAGYNVLTWDPRGFGASTGTVEVDSPKFEGRDVSALIGFVAKQPEAQLDKKGDPRVGMAGGSYGGGIQLVAAAIDHRIDAIVPDIAWNSLETSLAKNKTTKSGWGLTLYAAAAAAGARLDPQLGIAATQAAQSFQQDAKSIAFFRSRGPGRLTARIKAPTLLIQGTVDTLFTLQEAVDNYELLAARRVPVKMLWFCGGHGVCLTKAGDTRRIQRDTLAWLARYLKGRKTARTGPGFEWLDQNGHSYDAPKWPLPSAPGLSGRGSGTLQLVDAGGSGPAVVPPGSLGALPGSVAGLFAAAKAGNAVDVPIRAPKKTTVIVGAPRVSFSYRGTAPSANARVLAQIVDEGTGKVLGNQITPLPVTLDGATHSLSLPLEMVAATAKRGSRFMLQLVAQSKIYDTHPQGGSVAFSKVNVTLPGVRP